MISQAYQLRVWLSCVDERVDQLLRVVEVHILIDKSMYNHKSAFSKMVHMQVV